MPRKRARLTRPRKKPQNVSGGDPDSPSTDEWAGMVQYGSFIVKDDDNEEHSFCRGDYGLILPNKKDPRADIPTSEYWVGKISEIRARPETGHVWVKVQWFYSGNDVAGMVKSYKADTFGEYERLKSRHFDFVSSLSFSETTKVHEYDEVDIDQDQIDPNDFFCRYTFDQRTRIVDPKPVGTCFCSQSYNPSTDTMHVCPRPSCRKAYHRECLINSNSVESPKTKSDRHLRLITTSPDDDEIFTLTDLVPTPAPPTTKSKKAPNIPPPKASDELLATLPTALVCIAQQQIVRGVFGGGLVGNVKAVTVARRLIYEAIQEGFLRGDWEEVIADAGPMTNTGGNVAKKAKKGANWDMLVCTKCKGPV